MCPGFSETHKNTSLWAWRAVASGTLQRMSSTLAFRARVAVRLHSG